MSKNLLNELEELAAGLLADIKLATHREEHIRVTARANKAQEIVNRISEILTDVDTEVQEERQDQ
jgi:phosphotransferase system HPr-like phosphotransfer protein